MTIPANIRTKKRVSKSARIELTKIRRQSVELPKPIWDGVKKNLEKYNIKSFQSLFDYLIVSGVVFLKREIIDLIREKTPEMRATFTEKALKRLKGVKTGLVPIKRFAPTMYDRDYESFGRFCIEENTKKFWIIALLFGEFAKENPIIIDHIKLCQKLNVTQRKKELERVSKLEYIILLSPLDADQILERNTKKYDKSDFGTLLQAEVQSIMKANKALIANAEKEKTQKEKLDDKINRLAAARNVEIKKIEEPVEIEEVEEDFEGDESDEGE